MRDIPFQRALAGAYTICDNYFCSIQGPTTPNRLYLWTGTIDPGGTQGGPATFNPPDYNPGYNWTTYPERLQTAGVSWQVYANHEVGDGARRLGRRLTATIHSGCFTPIIGPWPRQIRKFASWPSGPP